jgi:hypothetical protein
MTARSKRLASEQARVEAAKASARAKRAELGLEPVPAENAEYEAQEAARKARRMRKRS